MLNGLPLQPDQASTFAVQWDHLFYFLTAIAVFFGALIFILIIYFAIKYRRRSEDEVPPEIHSNLPLEITWTVIPAGLCVVMFLWATELFISYSRPPAAAMEVFVVAKQWMWKVQHPEGPREINRLHVPVGVPIRLTMTSEDVIHDFAVPAFRIKKDVVPGRYTTEWFNATKVGRYHLFCDQYCGTGHPHMIGWVEVMNRDDFERWVSSQVNATPMSTQGQILFQQLGCGSCHVEGGTSSGPPLAGLFGAQVKLQNGQTVVADDNYLRSAILTPQPVVGYKAVMPTFQGQITEEQMLSLLAYVKSLSAAKGVGAKQ